MKIEPINGETVEEYNFRVCYHKKVNVIIKSGRCKELAQMIFDNHVFEGATLGDVTKKILDWSHGLNGSTIIKCYDIIDLMILN